MISVTPNHQGLGCTFSNHHAELTMGNETHRVGICWQCAAELQAALPKLPKPLNHEVEASQISAAIARAAESLAYPSAYPSAYPGHEQRRLDLVRVIETLLTELRQHLGRG